MDIGMYSVVQGFIAVMEVLGNETHGVLPYIRDIAMSSDGQFFGAIIAICLVFTGHPILGFFLAMFVLFG